nr:uncharacterized protein LOC110087408 [Pogona vitticeps]
MLKTRRRGLATLRDQQRRRILTSSLEPGSYDKLYKCHFQDELRCEVASFGEKIPKLKNFQPGIAIAQSSEQILACLQQRRRQRRQATEELNGICVLLGPHFQEKALVNLTDIIETKLSQSEHVRQRRSNDGNGFGGFHINSWRPTTTGPCRSRDDAQDCNDRSSTIGSKILGTNNNNNNNMGEKQKEEEDESCTLRHRAGSI